MLLENLLNYPLYQAYVVLHIQPGTVRIKNYWTSLQEEAKGNTYAEIWIIKLLLTCWVYSLFLNLAIITLICGNWNCEN